MSWNYRVIKRTYTGMIVFGIHEVFYGDNGEPVHCTAEPVYPQGDSLDELRGDLQHYRQALDAPVLDYDSFEQERKK